MKNAVSAADELWPSSGQAWSAVALLSAAYFIAYIDRSILSLLVEPIKHSLHLSDTQIGLLQGAAFSLFFMVMTIPAGWFADRGNRMRLIGFGIACWSIMTASSGLCASFAQLFVARMGVATGEATLTPVAPSAISDSFAPDRRTLPLSLYQMGAGMGVGASLIAGGFIAGLISGHDAVAIPGIGAFEPWQITFFAVGLPGLLLSLMFFLAHEPRRREQGQTEGTLREFVEAIKLRRGIILPHLVGYCFFQTYGYAYFGWLPAFFMRVHGWTVGDVGLRYGFVHLASGIVGAIAGGWFARLLWRRGRRDANLLAVALFAAALVVPAVLASLVPSASASVVLFGLTTALIQAPGGANAAAIQEIVPNRLRGRITALYYVAMGLSSMTLGPLVIGVMNDHIFTGAGSVGKSMSLTALLTLPVASMLLFIAARHRAKLA